MEELDRITIKLRNGNSSTMYINREEWELQRDWLDYREYLLFKYPPTYLQQNGTKRIPDKEGEIDSFQNWKDRGKPQAGLFGYGKLVENDFAELKQKLGII